MKVSYSLPSLAAKSFCFLAKFFASFANFALALSAFSFSLLAYSHKTLEFPRVVSEKELEQATQGTVISCMNVYGEERGRSKSQCVNRKGTCLRSSTESPPPVSSITLLLEGM